jgi:FkbM family methyltransferase
MSYKGSFIDSSVNIRIENNILYADLRREDGTYNSTSITFNPNLEYDNINGNFKIINYSQLEQDLEVLNYYNHKTNGFFIEIGASDGIELSNTYLLETKYNWKGICVEPIPYRFNSLCNNRPNSFCCNNAVYNRSDLDVIFDIANNGDGLSGISDNIDCHKEKVNSNKTQITVKTISFNDLLEKYNAPLFIEYLSLDTEGSELEILKSVNLNKYIFGIIHVEHNYIEPRRSEIRDLLTSNGYQYIKENNVDDCYKYQN